jgi:hypothetical protein
MYPYKTYFFAAALAKKANLLYYRMLKRSGTGAKAGPALITGALYRLRGGGRAFL